MLWAAAVNRPMEGSILRAGNGGWGGLRGRRALPGVPGGGSAGNGGFRPCPRPLPNHRWRVASLSSGRGELGVDVPPLEHRVLQVGRIHWGQGYGAQVVGVRKSAEGCGRVPVAGCHPPLARSHRRGGWGVPPGWWSLPEERLRGTATSIGATPPDWGTGCPAQARFATWRAPAGDGNLHGRGPTG